MNGGKMLEQQQLYYEEREKGRSDSFHRRSRGQQLPPSPRYGPDQRDPRYRNGYRDRHTIDRERFPKYPEPNVYDDDDDIEEANVHISRRDRMRDRDYRDPGPSPQQNRRMMRHSEDRQMGGSPRYQRPNGECDFINFEILPSTLAALSFSRSIFGSTNDAT